MRLFQFALSNTVTKFPTVQFTKGIAEAAAHTFAVPAWHDDPEFRKELYCTVKVAPAVVLNAGGVGAVV